MELKSNKIIENLSEKTEFRLTLQRKKILEILIENSDKHISAEEIYLITKEKDDVIGLATIYRTLGMLEKMGFIIKHDFGDGIAKYEYALKKKENHHHLVCKRCGKIIEGSGLLPRNLSERLLKEKDFQCTDYNLTIYGYCKECKNKLKNP